MDPKSHSQQRGSKKVPSIKITILKADPPSADPQSVPSHYPITESTPTSDLSEEEKSDPAGDLNALPIMEKLRSSTRKKRIIWHPSVPEKSSKVQYVNVATAGAISPISDRGSKPSSGVPSTTPSPVDETRQTFTEVAGANLGEFANASRSELPLIYQHPGASSPKHSLESIRLKVPRKSMDNLQNVFEDYFRPELRPAKENKVRSLAEFLDPVHRSDYVSVPRVLEEGKVDETSGLRKMSILSGDPRKRTVRSTLCL